MNFIFVAAGVLDKIGDTLKGFFFGILLFINAVVYSLISLVYQIFLAITQSDNILSNEIITGVVNRLYIILSVVILFVVAYSLLKNMINPDEALKGKKSPITLIRDVIISIVLIALIPTIFDFAFDFQNSVLQYNTIGKIIAGSTTNDSTYENNIRNGGYTMASGVWQAFLYPGKDSSGKEYCKNKEQEEKSSELDCKPLDVDGGLTYGQLWENAKENTTFWELLDIQPKIMDGTITYLFPFDLIAGAFVLLVLLSYCLDMALRLVKLSVFELIAPIAIMARIIPDEKVSKVFSNWLKATLSTFVEVFIRIAILYFAVIIITEVGDSITDAIGNAFTGGGVSLVKMIAKALIIVGIILFVKQAPGIIKDITGLDGSKYNVLGSAMRAAGSIGALGTGTVRAFNTSRKNFEEDPNQGSLRNNFNKYRKALGSSLLGGTKSFIGASQREYKSLKDVKDSAHSSVEAVINKQRQRQADASTKKRDLQTYRTNMKQGAHEPNFVYKARKTKLGSKLAKDFKDFGENVTEWAGASGSDSITDSRTREAISSISTLVGGMQDIWKKDPGYIKAKEEKNNAEAFNNAVINYANNLRATNPTYTSTQIDAEVEKRFGTGINEAEAQRRADVAKSILESQERTLQTASSKVDAIAGKILEAQQTQKKYGELSIVDIDKLTTISASQKTVIKKYQDMTDDKTYQLFVDDLNGKNGVSAQNDAIAYLDALDKLDIAGKHELAQIQARAVNRPASGKKEGN